MLVVWRGYGWLVPIMAIGFFVLLELATNSVFGQGYYKSHEWPKMTAIVVSSISIGLLGYILNYKKRVVLLDEESGEKTKSKSHTLFFIPLEYWALIVPAFFIWADNYSAEKDARDVVILTAPKVNDLYAVDFSKIFEDPDKEYKYGVFKVTAAYVEDIVVVPSVVAYDKKSGPRKDISGNKTGGKDYFSEDAVFFKKSELLELKEREVIFAVSRK